ncbi:uncharacterized protein LOC123699064 [Colias croceus]|uniref:uncharacterized protein LOC123699064 n=1 Tax=Colias crocea TaxID=72248 RepID=UPI001E27C096|nr:uncharacterized protein LOC123699064 [Colias croceus]
MANKCNSCGKFFGASDSTKCNKCNITYHRQCNHISPSSRNNNKWICKICTTKTTSKTVDDTQPESQESDNFEDVSTSPQGSTSLIQEIKLLRSELSSFRSEISRLSTLVSNFGSRLDSIEERVSHLESEPCIEIGQKQVQQNQELIESLKGKLNDSEQEKLQYDVEITGIPESNGENLLHITITLAQKIGLTLDERDIANAHRRGPKRLPESSSQPRPIIVRLTRKPLRDKLLQAARVRRSADTSGTGLSGDPCRFYLNEHLTYENRNLFYLTREKLGRTKNWRFIWTRGGRIYARQDNKSKVINIRTEDDLDKVFHM